MWTSTNALGRNEKPAVWQMNAHGRSRTGVVPLRPLVRSTYNRGRYIETHYLSPEREPASAANLIKSKYMNGPSGLCKTMVHGLHVPADPS